MSKPPEPYDRKCEHCRFWNQGDISARDKQFQNVGVCNKLTDILSVAANVPYWATELLHLTKSYDGKFCATWQLKGPKKK